MINEKQQINFTANVHTLIFVNVWIGWVRMKTFLKNFFIIIIFLDKHDLLRLTKYFST